MILPDQSRAARVIDDDEIVREVHRHKEAIAREFGSDPSRAREFFQQLEHRLRREGWQVQPRLPPEKTKSA